MAIVTKKRAVLLLRAFYRISILLKNNRLESRTYTQGITTVSGEA